MSKTIMHGKSTDRPFITPAWQQHAELLNQLCLYSQNILLVIAPIGGGKTTFLNYFMGVESASVHKTGVQAHQQESIEAFIAQVGKALQVNFKENEPWYRSIHDRVDELSQGEKVCALLVDDAHLLSLEHLKVLIELSRETPAHKSLRVVLIAEPSLELRLFSPDFANLIKGNIYTIELEAWSLSETQQFITQDTPETTITSEQSTTLYEQTQGLPGRVLQEQDKLKTKIKQTGDTMKKQKKFWGLHPVSLGVVAGIIVGGSYLVLNNSLEEETATPPTNSAQISENNDQVAALPKTNEDVSFHFDKVDKSDPVEADIATTEENTTTEAVAVTAPASAPAVTEPPKAPIVVAQTEVTPMPTAEPKVENTPVTTKAAALDLSSSEKRLLAMSKERYTLQLIGASKEQNVKKFVLQHALNDQAYQFKTKRAGRDWYVVVYGEYATKEEAKAAIKKMPESLKRAQLQPWVRDIHGVQTDIAKSQG